jgi:uncharacterized protein (DUF4213/DUF364 family)
MTNDVLERAYECVRALYREEHLTAGLLRKIAIKAQWNVVLATEGQAGMALNFTGLHSVGDLQQSDDMPAEIGALVGRPLTALVEAYLHREDVHRRAICLAALNALSQPLFAKDRLDRAGFSCRAGDLAGLVRPTDVVTVVGYGGLVRQFLGRCRELHVTELRPSHVFETTVIGEHIEIGPRDVVVHPAEDNEPLMARSDVVLITGSTLVNGTFDELVPYAAKARVRAIYGPSAQLPPEFFFTHGLNLVRAMTIGPLEKFEYDMINDLDMEVALRCNQSMWEITREPIPQT